MVAVVAVVGRIFLTMSTEVFFVDEFCHFTLGSINLVNRSLQSLQIWNEDTSGFATGYCIPYVWASGYSEALNQLDLVACSKSGVG
jgi:hypothetical protein